MQDGQDDELGLSGADHDQAVDVHEWLDAAIRAAVVAEHGFHQAPPTAAAEWPEPQDLDEVAASDTEPAPFTPASAVRLRDRGVASTAPLRKSLDPVRVPVPKPRMKTRRDSAALLLRYGPVVGGAAVVAYGIAAWGTPPLHNITVADARPVPVIVDAQTEAQLAPHLIVHDQHVMANEPLPLEVSVDRTVPNASLRVAGLASGTHMSAGSPVGDSGWNVPLNGLKNLFMYAPTDFVGVMDSAVDLRGPDQKLMDRRKVKLEWVEPKKPMSLVPPPKPAANPAPAPTVNAPPVPAMSAEVTASLLQRGQDYLQNGDIASARIVFTRLAAAGVADGAFAAGETYDSAYLATHNVFGVRGDEAKAREYYQRAVKLGSAEAAAHLAGAAPK